MLFNLRRTLLIVVVSAIAGAGSMAWADHDHWHDRGDWHGHGFGHNSGRVSFGDFGHHSRFNTWGLGGIRFDSGRFRYGSPFSFNYYRPYSYRYYSFPYVYPYFYGYGSYPTT